MSINIFVWAVAQMCHAASHNFGGLFACRVFLGICEGAITPGFLLVTSMFYTRQEQSQRVGYWCEYLTSSNASSLVLTDSCSPHERLGHYSPRAYRVWCPPHQVDDLHGMAVVRIGTWVSDALAILKAHTQAHDNLRHHHAHRLRAILVRETHSSRR